MARAHEYCPDFVDIIFGGIIINGYADGTFVDIEYEEDQFKKQTGSLGDVTRTRQLNRSGKITFTLMDSAPVNSLLMAVALEDMRVGGQFRPFSFVDRSSETFASATECWVMKLPKIERAKESGKVTWTLEAASIDIFIGGSVF